MARIFSYLPIFSEQKFNEMLLAEKYSASAIKKYQELFVGDGDPLTYDYTNATAEEVKDVYFACPTRALARYL